MPAVSRTALLRHLAACDFCGAEAAFYRRYPVETDSVPIEPCELPHHLREFAESVLKRAGQKSALENLAKV
ncbi:MAG: hypothetical protein LC730_05180 [Acidobacteria bacterium]|nr:hypothetical protein [Acidobacteriota bacterium]